jgi:preprotein translocase subunit Sec63
MKEITAAARGEIEPTVIDYEEAYSIFSLKKDDNPSMSDVNRAYRKACLKCHPDKGGDLDEVRYPVILVCF